MIKWNKRKKIESWPLKEVMMMSMTKMKIQEVAASSKNKLFSTQIKEEMEQNVSQK